MSVRCLQGEPVTPPKLNTINVSSLTFSSAVSGGNITSDGGAPVTERGVCWDMSPNPTIYHNRTFDGTGPGAFTSPITGLMPGTTYFIRAYATNSSGTAYGNEIIFTTEFPVLIFDGSGNNCVGSRSYLRLEIFGATPPFTVNLIRNGEIQPPVTGYMPGSEIETGFLEPGIHVFEIMSVMEAESNSIPPHAFPSPYSLEIYDLPDASPSSNNLPVICNDGVTDITLRSGSANCDFIYTATYSPSVTWLPGKSPESGVRFNGEGSRLEQNLAHTSNQPVVVTYTIMPQITGTSSCIGIPAIINVTVAPEVNISPVTDMILCNGEASPPVVFTTVNTGALYTYTWTSSNASIGLPASGTGFIPSFVAVNTADSPLLSTITVTPHYNSGPVLCQGVSQNFNIIVNPTPRVVPVNIEPEICSGEYMQIQLTSPTVFTTGMTTFDYSVSAPEGITGNADPGTGIAPGEDLSFQYSNNTDTVQTVWFYITPKNESLGCIGNPVIQEVRVHPTPVQGIHLIRPFTCEESTGRAAIHAELSEGAEPYRISWQGPVGFFAEDQVDIDDLIAGYYTVRVTDRLGCTNDAAINVQNLSASPRIVPYPILPDINISCAGGDDGTARIYVRSGVTAPYFYTLLHNETDSVCSGFFSDVYNPSDPSTYRVCEGLTAGLYELKILDINGCETIRLTKLNEPEPLSMQFTVSDYNGTNVTCPGYNDGYINTSLIGGLGILVYNWTGPGGFSSTAKDISGLAAGEYTLTVTDAMGCSLTRSLILTGPEPLDAVVDHVDIYCHGSNNGTIRISEPQGGSGTFEFSIKGGSDWHSIMEFSGLGQGIYDVRMRDALSSGCEMILDSSLVILEPSGLTAILSSTNVSCYGGNNGIINITAASGGYGSHEFSINGGLSWSASGLFQYLAPGVYNVQMRDGDHPECIVILDPALTISEPAELSATLYSTDLSCSGTNDGTITISMPVGGHGTYHFSIDRGTTWHTSGHFTGLTTGTYNVQIRDAVQPGCFRILNELLIISQPEHLSAIVRKTDISCGNDGDGTILIESPSGGYGSYEYTIDGGSTWNASGLFDELESGLYDVRMRDRANPACYIVLNPALEIFPSGDATLTSNLNPSAICSGSRFVYDATSSIIEATLDWTRPAIEGLVEPAGSGTGNIDEVLTNLTSEPLDVIYLYTVAHGDCSNTSIVTVTVYPAPRARAGGSQIVCIGDSVNVSGTSYSGGIINWKCYGNGGFSGSETLNPTYTPVPSDAGKTILLTMTVTGTGSCSHMSDSAHYWVIVREPQTITFNTLAEKVYGDPSFELTASSSSSLDVNFTCNNDSVIVISGKTVTIKGAGTATIYAHQSGNDFYCPALPVSLTITIDPKPISVMADTALTKTYGDADPVLSYSVYPGLAGTDKLQGNLSREDGENAGRNYVIYQGTLNAGPDYNMTFIPGRMFINPKPVTVTPNPGQNKTYGSDDPVLEFMIDPDLVKGDVVSGALTRSPGENAGSYLIKRGTLSLGNNYSLIYFPGYFTINKAFLTVIVDRKERTYLENNPEFGISLLGFVRGEDERVVDTLPSLDPLPDAMSDAGEYVITASGGLDNNYSFNYLNGSLTINKAKQEILSFNPLPKFLRTTQRFPLEASSSSGLAVTFVSSDADKATIEDDVLTIIKEGAVNIYAIQEGDKNWNPAPAIYQTVIGQPTFDNVTSLFTPNSDGMNDHWHIVNIEDFGAVEVKVYNRFGKLVYESSDYKNDWKGDFNGSPLPEASYYYIIKSAKKGVVKGVVNIVR
ncbi:MAG: gliding motility-associated C-terminal domain-containing protein [Bacteroidales bacterium]|nr:gliding motility-associated C-terminal domain-containing protein [Bacteroidales bacterium]